MEAPSLRKPACAGCLAAFTFLVAAASAAEHRTTNFVVTAPTADIAKQVAETAERCRRDLSLEWLGRELPNWFRPCPVTVQVGRMGAGGATTFTFDRGEVSGWNMRVQGSLERVLDSVIPHEVSHTIFASHFRRPLPRWADEGAATLIEHADERKRQEVLLERVIHTSKRIPLDRLLTISEYPSDMQQVYTLYAEGYSLANFLVQQHGSQGKAVYLKFLQDAHQHDWTHAIKKHYRFGSVGELEETWTGWVLAGSPPRYRREGESIAANPGAAAPVGGSPATKPGLDLAQAALSPLAPVTRALRQSADRATIRANSSALAPPDHAAMAGRLTGGAARPADERVTPRVSPFPGRDFSAQRRLQQIHGESLAAARRGEQLALQQSTAARTADPSATVLRGQSPDHWSRYAGFPGSAGEGDGQEGRRIPFTE
jgi:hypothetical protein